MSSLLIYTRNLIPSQGGFLKKTAMKSMTVFYCLKKIPYTGNMLRVQSSQ